jgi:hypothetical protein
MATIIYTALRYRAFQQQKAETWIALLALVLISIGQFAKELSVLGVPGIWFPFGTGVSRTQFAYAIFDAVLFVLLLRQILLFAQSLHTDTLLSSG